MVLSLRLFSRRQRARLLFHRWRYLVGQLTEWPKER